MEEIKAILASLAKQRPLFHSEADFQHSLAWALRETGFATSVRLERPFDVAGQRMNLDLLAMSRGEPVGFELKYWTRGTSLSLEGESFALKNQAAQDISRYDFWKDVLRLERLVDAGFIRQGFAIALTNDGSYWRTGREGSIDTAFRMHEGRVVTGPLAWTERAGAGTTRGREIALNLRSQYQVSWLDYATPGGSQFRFVLLPVRAGTQDST